MNRLLDQLFRWLAQYPRTFALVAVIGVVLMAAMIRAPVIEGSMVDQLSSASPGLVVEQRIAAARGNVTGVIAIVTPRDLTIGEVFDGLLVLQQELAALSDGIDVRTILDVSDQLFVYGLTREQPVFHLLEALRSNAQSRTVISADGRRFLVAVTGPDALEQELLDALKEHNWSDISVEQTTLASLQLERDIASGLAKDLRLLIPAIVVLMLFALFLAFGHWRALLLPVFASVAATVVIFALFSVAAVTINLVTLLALPIVLIVGLANSCHFLAKSRAVIELREDVDDAVIASLRRVGPPFLLSTLTTSIALASLGLNKLAPIANLGLLSAAALAILFVLVSLAAPLLLRFYLFGSTVSLRESGWYRRASQALAASRRQVSVVLVLLALLGGASVPFLSVNSDPRIFFPDNAPFSAALEAFENDFYVFSPLRVLVSGRDADADGLAVLQKASQLRVALADHDEVRLISMQPAANSSTAFVLTALTNTVEDLGLLRDRVEQLRGAADDSIDIVYSSAAMVYEEIDREAMQSLLRSLSYSVILIFGTIVVVFRSVRALLCTALANAVPLLLVCGTVWLIGDPLNLVTLFVFLVALGVIVDDSIHILFWEASGDRLSGSSIEFSVVLSTAMLCLGLLLCQLSDFPTTRQFASYCAIALIAAVISDLSLLPLTLRWRAKMKR